MESVIGPLVLLLAFSALVAIGFPPRSRIRLKVKRREPIQMPQTCVITGEAATEKHVVKGFTGTPYYIGKSELELPFSANGWKFFRRKFPTSLFLFKAGLNMLMAIPFFGPFFAIFTWTPIVGFFCGLIALIEYPMGRRQLLFPVAVNVKGDCLVGIDLWGVSKG